MYSRTLFLGHGAHKDFYCKIIIYLCVIYTSVIHHPTWIVPRSSESFIHKMEDEGLKTELDLASYHGLVVPSKLTNFELFNQSMNYEPPNGDIVIASYPKSGTEQKFYFETQFINCGSHL